MRTRMTWGQGSRRGSRLAFRLTCALAALAMGTMWLPEAALGSQKQTVPAAPPAQESVAGDWTQFQYDPNHTGFNPLEKTLSQSNVGLLHLAWTSTPAADVEPEVAVADGVVYVGSWQGTLYAYKVGCSFLGGTCSPIWKGVTGGGIFGAPAVVNGRVYVGSSNGVLYAYAVGCGSGGATCVPLWTARTKGPISSAPTVSGNVVYIGSDDWNLYAFSADGTTGCSGTPKGCAPLWSAGLVGRVMGSPAVYNGMVYADADGGDLRAFKVGCGSGGAVCQPTWRADIGSSMTAPTVSDNTVFVVSSDNKLYAFGANCGTGVATCKPLWTAATASEILVAPAVAYGSVYVASTDNVLYAFDAGGTNHCSGTPKKCTPLWISNTGTGPLSGGWSAPVVANSVVYAGSSDGRVYAFPAGCGASVCAPLWTAQAATQEIHSVVVSGGTLYAGSLTYVAAYNTFKLPMKSILPLSSLLAVSTPPAVASIKPLAAQTANITAPPIVAGKPVAVPSDGSSAAPAAVATADSNASAAPVAAEATAAPSATPAPAAPGTGAQTQPAPGVAVVAGRPDDGPPPPLIVVVAGALIAAILGLAVPLRLRSKKLPV